MNFNYSASSDDDFIANSSAMARGIAPLKTTADRLKYYRFYLTPHKTKVKTLISICDMAGEFFDTSNTIGEQIGLKNVDAFIMLIDPLSISKYRELQVGRINLMDYGASEQSIDEVMSTLISTLENLSCTTARDVIEADIAVVFTKCDIPGLDNIIGLSAVHKYQQEHGNKSFYSATNAVCEKFLIDYEEQNFLNNLKSKFKSVQFFTCSSLGHVVNGSKFTPNRVVEPLCWTIDNACKSINLKEILEEMIESNER